MVAATDTLDAASEEIHESTGRKAKRLLKNALDRKHSCKLQMTSRNGSRCVRVCVRACVC